MAQNIDLKNVEIQTPEICLAAVKQNAQALEYVEIQTPEIYETIMEENRNIDLKKRETNEQ